MKTKFCIYWFLLIQCTSLCSTAQSINETDSLALVDLYNNMDGSNWRHKDNWFTGSVNSWWGIGVTGDRVTYVNLSNNRLKGNLPSSIGNLTAATYLDLSLNHLNNSIPSSIGNLVELTHLDLGANYMKGALPVSIGNLTKLVYLNLYANNNISGILPSELGNLTELETLDLSFNSFTGSIPSTIVNLTKLKLLSFQSNKLTGSIPPSIGNLQSLETLKLSINSLNGTIPGSIGELSNLMFLDLSSNQLNDVIPADIGKLVKLTYLDLSSNLLNGNIPVELGDLLNLRNGYFSANRLTGSIPSAIGNMANVAYLGFDNNQLSGTIPSEIGNLVNLYYLGLNNNNLSGSVPKTFSNLQSLVNLYLNNNLLTNVSSVSDMKGLRVLRINDNKLSGKFPQPITKMNALEQLVISGNQLSGFFPNNISNMTSLLRLDVTRNHYNFDGLEQLSQVFHFADYNNQAPVAIKQIADALSVAAGGTVDYNVYTWYKAGQSSPVATVYGDSIFHPVANGRYYAAITNVIALDATLYTDTIDFDIALPVSVVKFSAQQQGDFINITWTGVTEINVDRYEVLRSADANSFSAIGYVAANGNSQTADYFFKDHKPMQGNNYYRLKIIDKDGKISYSKIVMINMLKQNFFVVYPLPAKDVLHILSGDQNISFSLVDGKGKVLITKTTESNATLDVSGFAPGIYYLRNNKTGKSQKVIIIR